MLYIRLIILYIKWFFAGLYEWLNGHPSFYLGLGLIAGIGILIFGMVYRPLHFLIE